MMRMMLIGHRGVGKSSLLMRLKNYFSNLDIVFLSLDQEIEKLTEKKISDIFLEKGEGYFRLIEEEVFSTITSQYRENSLVVDMGAGFYFDKPSDWQALWLQRAVDLSQAQFLNRPNLDGELKIDPMRFNERTQRYQEIADWQLELIEGQEDLSPEEKNYFSALFQVNEQINTSQAKQPYRWSLTLLDDQHSIKSRFLKETLPLSFELRDDLLSQQAIEETLNYESDCLLSFRSTECKSVSQKFLKKVKDWDWPLEWGENREASILSLHQRKESVLETLTSLPETEQIIKLAIPIENFKELALGLQWQQEHPQKRVFLPHSKEGRWSWFRLLMSASGPLNFVREAGGPSPDQPTLLEVLNFHSEWSQFAAILGQPVRHSLTPAFHRQFFKAIKANILRINVAQDDFQNAFPLLEKLGLRYAALTSPLKKVASQFCETQYEAINSLAYSRDHWVGTSTDEDGLKSLMKNCDPGQTVVWGGGGVHSAIESLLPNCAYHSSRTGELKRGHPASAPKTILWAVGGENFSKQGSFPPSSWPVERVIDLNYSLDSPGIACAQNYGCQYQSGRTMFVEQAKKQQEFWFEYRVE